MGKKSQKTNKTSQTMYGNTTTSNPYATATTTNDGTNTSFKEGTALDTIYNYVNKNISSILDEYLNPTLNSTTNQAKLNSFTNALNNSTRSNLENNIINPLSNRNMIRSSQATDLYKNLSNANTNSLSAYIDELLAESQNNSAEMLNNLLHSYLQGYDVISSMQNQSLRTSAGNASTNSSQTTTQSGMNDKDIISSLNNLLDLYMRTKGL